MPQEGARDEQLGEIGRDRSAAVALNPNTTFVTMFKWRYNDIANECTRFLGPNGYGGVQISPPNAHITNDNWWNVYQPTNYTNLVSNQGNQADLQNMITTCHNAGVRVYADVVVNQMAGGGPATGTDGASYTGGSQYLGGIGSSYFHSACSIGSGDYNSNRNNVVNCQLVGLPDLATDTSTVRTMIGTYLNTLRSMGMDGYRLDAAKHMWPADIQSFLSGVSTTTLQGETRFLAQEVIPDGTVNRNDYLINGGINEFQFTYSVRDTFRNANGLSISQLPTLQGTGNGGGSWQLVPSANASIFVNNWDTERSSNAGDSLNLTNDSGGKYDLANIYMLAIPYGKANVESGFAFYHDPGKSGGSDVNAPGASPYDASGNAIFTTSCANSSAACGWDFVHRWSTIYPMVAFRNVTASQGMTNIQTGNSNQLAFGRGNLGFVALNNDSGSSWSTTFSTGLPAGTYCNVVHGLLNAAGTACASDSVTVSSSGTFSATIAARGGASISAIAIHAGQKVGSGSGGTIPPVPTGVSATATSSSAITVSWSASTGATSYTVYRSTSSGGTFSNIGNTTSTSFGDTGLTGSTAYYYKVTASNTIGESAQSTAVTATTSAGGGGFTSNFAHMYLRGTMNSWGATTMTLVANNTWQVTATLSASTAYQYKYEIGGTGTWSTNWGDSSSPQDGTAEVSSGTNINLTTGASTSYVFTFNDSSLAYSVVPCCGSAPSTPTGVAVAATSSTSLTVSWTAPSGATSYEIFRSPTSGGSYVSVGTSTTTNFLNTGLTASTTYWYKVTAKNDFGTSAQSTAASGATSAGSGFTANWPTMYVRGTMNAWAANTAMTLTANNTWSVTLNLSPSTQYQFKFDTGNWTPNQNWGASTTAGVAQAGTGNISYTTGTGTNYIFTFNDSTLAYSVSSTTPSIPAAPGGVTATATSSTAITIAWSASQGAASYTVKRGTASGGPYSTTVGTGLTGLSVGDSGLTANTKYYYVVTATNSAGTSGNSSEANATTQAAAGSTVTTIRVHYDVGPGNNITIRGSVSPLSWTTGAAATWTAGNIWVYTTTAITSGTLFDFKALRNDNFWSDGANFSTTGGSTIDVTPTFNGNFFDPMDVLSTNWTVGGTWTGTGKFAQGSITYPDNVTSLVAIAKSCASGCPTGASDSTIITSPTVDKTASSVIIGLKYTLVNMNGANDYLRVEYSTNGGSSWNSAGSDLKGNSTTPFKQNFVVSPGTSTFKIRFIVHTSTTGTTQQVTVDDVSMAKN